MAKRNQEKSGTKREKEGEGKRRSVVKVGREGGREIGKLNKRLSAGKTAKHVGR